jgi:hypothetical protein
MMLHAYKKVAIIFILFFNSYFYITQTVGIDISSTVTLINCVNSCGGVHLNCSLPATKDAITTMTARCFCSENNKPYCLKCTQKIPTTIGGLIERDCKLVDADDKELS